jgi:uncharacterized protein with HEPN domain
MEADQLGRLRDILEAARLVASYVHGVTEAEFRANTQKQDAVIRRIEIIGEATAHLNETTREAIPGLPFRKIRGMRNILAMTTLVWMQRLSGKSPPSMWRKSAACWRSSSLSNPSREGPVG